MNKEEWKEKFKSQAEAALIAYREMGDLVNKAEESFTTEDDQEEFTVFLVMQMQKLNKEVEEIFS